MHVHPAPGRRSGLVHRYYSWRMQRGTEVVHMLANETVIHNTVDP